MHCRAKIKTKLDGKSFRLSSQPCPFLVITLVPKVQYLIIHEENKAQQQLLAKTMEVSTLTFVMTNGLSRKEQLAIP